MKRGVMLAGFLWGCSGGPSNVETKAEIPPSVALPSAEPKPTLPEKKEKPVEAPKAKVFVDSKRRNDLESELLGQLRRDYCTGDKCSKFVMSINSIEIYEDADGSLDAKFLTSLSEVFDADNLARNACGYNKKIAHVFVKGPDGVTVGGGRCER